MACPRACLSGILHIIYRSLLLLLEALEPDADKILIACIDNVTHLTADQSPQVITDQSEKMGKDSPAWGISHGAIFDIKNLESKGDPFHQ